jgi:hypothetical protein
MPFNGSWKAIPTSNRHQLNQLGQFNQNGPAAPSRQNVADQAPNPGRTRIYLQYSGARQVCSLQVSAGTRRIER